MERPVDIRSLSQSLPLDICVLDSLAASKVDNVDLGLLDLDNIVLFVLRFDENGEDDMRSRTLLIHISHGDSSCFISFQQDFNCILVGLHLDFEGSLHKNSPTMVFPDLMDSFVL